MKKKPYSREEKEQLAKLAEMADEDIDTADIPEAPEESWALRRELFRPIKKPVTIRLDADILAWFKDKARGRGYQSEINRALRIYVRQAERAELERS